MDGAKAYCCTKSLFFELDTSNFGYFLIFYFAELCKVSARLDNNDIRHFIRVLFILFCNLPKIQRGGPYKMPTSVLFNLAET